MLNSVNRPDWSWSKKIRMQLLRLYSIAYARVIGIVLGSGSIIHLGAKVRRRGGRIIIGDDCEIHDGAMLLGYGGDIVLGDHVSINPYSILYGHGGLRVGDGVRIATHVVIIPANHGIAPHVPIYRQKLTRKGITIGNDVWIAAGVRILDGVNVPESCVIAAGAVVTPQEMLAGGVYGGVPARLLATREDLHS